MPPEGVKSLSHSEVLGYEEILSIVQTAAGLGIRKLRITGGEPLVRLGIVELMRMLSAVDGINDIALTTNGVLLKQYAAALKEAGLKRVNISLDTLHRDKYLQITRMDRFESVMDGIAAAKDAGLDPVKINTVVIRGLNDEEVVDFARLTIDSGWHVRFIEPMPFVPDANFPFVPIGEILERIAVLGELQPCLTSNGNGPAKYFRFAGAQGTVGFISPLSDCFCSQCNRLRLTVDGMLRPCLLSDKEIDLRSPLRSGASIEQIRALIVQAVREKPERHNLDDCALKEGRTMCQMGG